MDTKNLLFYFAFLAVGQSCICPAGDIHWGYHVSNGPSLWCSMQDNCCGQHQSPIHIDTTKVKVNENLKPIGLDTYDEFSDFTMKVKNTGFTVQFSPQLDGGAIMTDGCVTGVYVLEQLHFHWGSLDRQGSEHALDDHIFPLEMHMLHRNAIYDDVHAALLHDDGIAVVAVLFELNSTDANPTYDLLAEQLQHVPFKGMEYEFSFSGTLMSLLPNNMDDFFCYAGSLTTPTCEEVVTWTVLKDRVHIEPKFLHDLRILYAGANDVDSLSDNFRNVQPLNGRTVTAHLINHNAL